MNTVPAVRLESIGVTDRTDPILQTYLILIHTILDQDLCRETGQVELISTWSAGHEEFFETLSVVARKRLTDRVVNLVTAGARGRPHRRGEAHALRNRPDGAQTGLDDP